MKKKVISMLLSVLVFAAIALPAVAATFPDVTSTSYSWALEAVEEMVEDGIIKGYTDNTFKPGRTVTKMEALVLSARILGFTDEAVEPFAAFAAEFYADILEKYDIPYKAEVAFLLYKEVLSEKELSFYIGGDNANAGMKRYEVAKLLTCVMGAADETNADASTGEYKDSADIPADAKPFVRFVTDAGLMNGMDGGNFVPMGEVNRAQIATLLYRMRGLAKETFQTGVVKEVDGELESLVLLTEDGEEVRVEIPYDIEPLIKQDGYSVEFSRIALGADILVTSRDKVVYSLDILTNEPDLVFEGAISSVNISGSEKKLSVFPLEDTENIMTYPIAETASITYEGSTGALKDLKRLQAVKLQIREGEIVVIEAFESERSIKGTIESIVLEPVLAFGVRLTNGTVEMYPVASAVTAKRNNSAVDIDEILVGDKVTITLRYEKVAAVVATSSKFMTQGTIEEIVIATLPSIKIRANNAVSSYSLARDCVYTVDGKTGTIYDLRLGANISASVDSETIVSLTSTAPASSAAITGTIETINASYGFFTLTVPGENGTVSSMQVFTKRTNLKVINSVDGATKTAKDLKAGMQVSVTGAISNGAFEATTIIIMPAE